jgi:23S rRNA pseudouridine1911/1915/1917 synthase
VRKKLLVKHQHLTVLFEDPYVIAVEKPTGMLSSGHSQNEKDSMHALLNAVKQGKNHGRPFHVVHRLDQKVSGVLLFAKTEEILTTLQDQWQCHKKYYHALVEGTPPEDSGTVESWLSEDENYKVTAGPKSERSKWAVTHYEVEKKFRNQTLLRIRLETGRKHQIRVQMAQIGCPIVGDAKYGAKTDHLRRVALHCYLFILQHPVSAKLIEIHCPSPKAFGHGLIV